MNLTLPFTALQLVDHASGGLILRDADGYIAGTLISPAIVHAFSVASSAIASLGAGAGSVATSPVVLGGAAIATVAVGAYCYFYGLPAPIVKALASAGLGVAKKKAFVVAAPKLAVALVVLAAGGLAIYRLYKREHDLSKHQVEESATRPIDAPFWSDTSQVKALVRYIGPAINRQSDNDDLSKVAGRPHWFLLLLKRLLASFRPAV